MSGIAVQYRIQFPILIRIVIMRICRAFLLKRPQKYSKNHGGKKNFNLMLSVPVLAKLQQIAFGRIVHYKENTQRIDIPPWMTAERFPHEGSGPRAQRRKRR